MSVMHQFFGYYYYETPDYEDCAKKTFVGMKMATAYGAMMTSQHMIMGEAKLDARGQFIKIPKTYEYIGRSFIRYTWAPMSIAFAGAGLTCALANIRGQKDDAWNHMIGWGLITGLVSNMKWGSSGSATYHGLLAAVAAGLFKKGDEHDFIFVSNRHNSQRTVHTGTYGGDDWGDLRFGMGYKDPGRRPNN